LRPATAEVFKIARTFFHAAGTPAGVLGKSFDPEVMRLDPRTTSPWLLGVKSGLRAAGKWWLGVEAGCVRGKLEIVL
ncbi:lipopolysaccharide biosynthesis protein, partial [Escherichia coli]|nr:lipopolysaccharide biosynthesis protein [Escherichia coli]